MRTGYQLGWILASKIHQNLLLDGSWAVLWPSWAVLGRLGGLLRRLEEASKNEAKKECTKSQQNKKCIFRRLWGCVNEIMLASRGGLTGVRSSGGPGESQLIETEKALRRKPYTEKKFTESECRN